MSFNEIAIAVATAAIGAASGSFGVYIYKRNSLSELKKQLSDLKNSTAPSRFEDRATKIQRLIPRPQLEKTKRELRTLLLEKDLVSAALTRLYEAEASHEITREEREILGLKYREELKALDEKILKIDSFIEVGDLETLREQLISLVREKLDAVERRIEKAKMSSSPLLVEYTKPRPQPSTYAQEEPKVEVSKVPEISDLLTTGKPLQDATAPKKLSNEQASSREVHSSPSEPRKSTKTDDQVDSLQKELLEALDRLEKLDIES